jgi:hypothetical protein
MQEQAEPLDQPLTLHEHALDNLRFIRETMERAASFTSIPGWGGFFIGLTATAAAVVSQRYLPASPHLWIRVWLIEAVVAGIIGVVAMHRKGSRANLSFTAAPARRFFVSYSAPLITGAILTVVLTRGQFMSAIPAMWLLLYGTSFVSSGTFSIRVTPIMGVCFMLLGLAASFVSMPVANILLGLGFGGLHIVFGFIIARSYGG